MADRFPLRLIADDLTGALDSAAPFARPEAPVEVGWSALVGQVHPDTAVSSESRAMSSAEACAAVRRCWQDLGGSAVGYLWFKKVDSVLRGHPLMETAEMLVLGGFDRCIFAPAFPQMGRITRSGHHWVQGAVTAWTPAAVHDLCAGFRTIGIPAERWGSPAAGHARVVVVDAESEHDLTDAVATVGRDAPVLWVGSGGLARALAGPVAPLPIPTVSCAIIGTTHPVTRLQVAGLGPARTAVRLIDPAPETRDGQETMRQLALQIAAVDPIPDRDITMIIGGDTLSVVLATVGAERLLCPGEAGPGLPVAQIVGGRWNGCRIVTKSGGFGDVSLLQRMVSGAALQLRQTAPLVPSPP